MIASTPHPGVRHVTTYRCTPSIIRPSGGTPCIVRSSGGAPCIIRPSGGARAYVVTRASTPNSLLSQPLALEMLSIAWPTLLSLACDPMASLVDTAWIGRMPSGAASIASVGVALSICNTLTKLLNNPLLSVSTSLIATAVGEDVRARQVSPCDNDISQRTPIGPASRHACTTALGLALCFGLFQTALLSGPLAPRLVTSFTGLPVESALSQAALGFLFFRGLGAPITTLLLITQGIFRGLGDAKTPLRSTVTANLINIILDPLLIFGVAWGIRGAAVATVAGQAIALAGLLYSLRLQLARCPPPPSSSSSSSSTLGSADARHPLDVFRFVKSTVLLLVRTVSVLGCFALATSIATRNGAVAGATHQICIQIWLATSLTADAVAVGAQTLLARAIGSGDTTQANEIVRIAQQFSLLLGVGLTLVMAFATATNLLPVLFTLDPATRSMVRWLLPVVAGTQLLNALAFTWDGILFGVNGFKYSPLLMALSAGPALLLMSTALETSSVTSALTITWSGLALLMLLRFLTIYTLYLVRLGPFRTLYPGS